MTKYITVKLTEDQVYSIIQAVEWSQDFENSTASDPHNRFLQRIIDKLAKAKTV